MRQNREGPPEEDEDEEEDGDGSPHAVEVGREVGDGMGGAVIAVALLDRIIYAYV